MQPDLRERVAVVTGAGGGLGRALARGLAEHGASVVLVGRRAAELAATAEPISAPTLVVATDVSVPAEVEALKARTLGSLGPPAILVNAAGMFGPLATIADSDPDDWIRTLLVNAAGPYLTCRAFVGDMVDAGWGRIVNVSSAGSLYPPVPLNSAYATSKTALNRFTRSLAAEVAGTGVTANVIHPGSLKTEMWADMKAKVAALGERAGVFRDWVELVEATGGDPLSKAVDLVLHLVGDGAAHVTGEFVWPEDALEEPVASW